jgi:AraC-like DNA-binding protein
MTIASSVRCSLVHVLSFEAAYRAYAFGIVRERARVAYAVQRAEPSPDVVIDTSCADLSSFLLSHRGSSTCCVRDLAALARDASDTLLHNASVVVVSTYQTRGRPSDVLVARLRARFPDLTIFVRSEGTSRFNELTTFTSAGADEVFAPTLSASDRSLAAAIRQRTLAPVPRRVLCESAGALPEASGRTIALWCLRNTYRKRSVADVAIRFGVDRKTASRRCRNVGAPPVATLLRLGRLYHAAELRRTSFLSQDEIARRLGFSNAVALVMSRARARRAELSLGHAAGGESAAPPWRSLRRLPAVVSRPGVPAERACRDSLCVAPIR